jgi:hypothetical protein
MYKLSPCLKFEPLTAVKNRIMYLWIVAPWSLLGGHQCSGIIYSTMEAYIHLKHWYPPTTLHDDILDHQNMK